MHTRYRVLIIGVAALSVAGAPGASASTRPKPVSVYVQKKLSVTRNIHIAFRPTDHLPQGGYYYAVVVLKPYRHYTRNVPPPCATSSNMEKTDYGYPHPGRPVALALTPAKSATGHWCSGGTYDGAVYAVPHPPPCNSTYPCRSENYEKRSPCFELENGRKACGVVAHPELYSYPDGLPKPLEQDTRIIGHFHVAF